MQTATILLALAGDSGNTVTKSSVTPAEVAVLRVLHGDDAVTEIQPTGEIQRSDREERARLNEIYGKNIEGVQRAPAVDLLFPGAAARVFHDFDELDIPDEFFAAEKRVSKDANKGKAPEPKTPTQQKHDATELDKMTKADLLIYAKEHDIEVDPKLSKADALQAIKDKQEERGKQPDGDVDGDNPAGDIVDADDGISDMDDGARTDNLFQ